jgi:hypothetical protein
MVPYRWIGALAVATGLFLDATAEYRLATRDIFRLYAMGFGAEAGIYIGFGQSVYSYELGSMIVLSNVPQLVLSAAYVAYNGIWTCMCLEAEWNAFGMARKSLRVTLRRGEQRRTHWLSLPMVSALVPPLLEAPAEVKQMQRYAIPQILVFAALHWLASQSLYLVRFTTYKSGQANSLHSITTCGYSPIALLFTIMFGTLPIIGILLAAARPLGSGIMPANGGCSVVISAACHPAEGDENAHLRQVRWGALEKGSEDAAVGHCCFTSREEEVGAPVAGKRYA